MKPWFNLFLVGFVFLSAVLHFYHLDVIPPGLSNDEANIGYEAWSVATTGKGQWGRSWPLTFEGFGNWSLPIYIYLTAPLIRLFGQTAFAVRLLSTVSGVTIVILAYVLVRRLRPQSLVVALASGALVAFTPWVIGLTRIATEAPLAMAFFMAGLYVFLISNGQRSMTVLISGIFILLSLFTYYGMWVFVPMYGLAIAWFFRKQLAARSKLLWLIGGVGITGIFLISAQQGGIARLKQVNLVGNPTIIGMLNEQRGGCELVYPSTLCRLAFNRSTRYVSEFVKNYFSHFSVREWFLANDAKGILPPGGYSLPIIAPLFAIGFFQLIVSGTRKEKVVFLSWLFLAPVADSLTGAGNFSRAFPMAPIVAIIAAYSVMVLPRFVLVIFSGIFTLTLTQFFLLYTSYFPVKHSPFTHYEYQPLMSLLKDEHQIPIYLSSAIRDTKQYIFYLWHAKIPPRFFQESATVVRETDLDGWVWVKQVDNWHFVKKLPVLLELPDEAVVVGTWKEEVMPLVELLETCNNSPRSFRTVDYLNKDPAFAVVRLRRVDETFCLVQ